jgi:hypothetical protein
MSRHCDLRTEKIVQALSVLNERPLISCYEVSSNRLDETPCRRWRSAPRSAQFECNNDRTISDVPRLRAWQLQLSWLSFAGLWIEIGILLLIAGYDGGRVIRLMTAAFPWACQDQFAAGFGL